MGSGGGIVRLGQHQVSPVVGGCVDELAAMSLSESTAPTDGKDSGMIPSCLHPCSLRYIPLILLET